MTGTVADIFAARGMNQWWADPLTQSFGGNANGEWGNDFALSPNTPVGSISDGRVVFVGVDPNHPQSSIGEIVQVQAPDGSLFHYQHLRAANVQVGQGVAAGDTIGLSGGCPVGGYAPGGGCSFTDADSTGPHIEVRYSPSYNATAGFWYQNWIDPASVWARYAGAGVNSTARSGLSTSALTQPGAAATGTTLSSGAPQWSLNCKHQVSVFPGASFCMDPVLDFGGRSALALAGAGLIVLAILTFLAGHEDIRKALGKHVSRLKELAPMIAAAG